MIMTVAVTVTVSLLLVAAFLFVGVPYLMFGRAGLRHVLNRPEPRMIGATLATGLIVAVVTPLMAAALISGGETVQVFASEINGLSFGL